MAVSSSPFGQKQTPFLYHVQAVHRPIRCQEHFGDVPVCSLGASFFAAVSMGMSRVIFWSVARSHTRTKNPSLRLRPQASVRFDVNDRRLQKGRKTCCTRKIATYMHSIVARAVVYSVNRSRSRGLNPILRKCGY